MKEGMSPLKKSRPILPISQQSMPLKHRELTGKNSTILLWLITLEISSLAITGPIWFPPLQQE